MSAPSRDYYQLLNVERAATPAEIKAAYRKAALRWHPDRNPGDQVAEERFKELSAAYAVLSDDDKRARYDRLGARFEDGPFGAETDLRAATDFFEAIFGDLFGTGRASAAGQDLRFTLALDFEEAALGCEKEICFERQEDCRACFGTGAEGGAASLVRCAACDGSGQLREKGGFFAAKRTCAACGGAGEIPKKRCATCAGTGLATADRTFVVRVPPGSHRGAAQRVAGEGAPGRRGGAAGDLHVNVRVRPHPFLREEDGTLIAEQPITFAEAALGAEVDVPLLDGIVRMKVPAGTQNGALFRIRGRGFVKGGGRADAHVRIVVETPTELDDAARELLRGLGNQPQRGAGPRRRELEQRMNVRTAEGKTQS